VVDQTAQTGFSGLLKKVEEHGSSDVIFDLDGTLIDSAPGIFGTISHVLASKGITPVRLLDHSIVGPPLETMFEELLAEHDRVSMEPLIEGYKRQYDQEGYKESRVFDGVEEALSSLATLGARMYIATNKRQTPTLAILHYFGWKNIFSSVYAVDSHGTRFRSKAEMLDVMITNERLQRELVLYVGDTKNDETAAAVNRIAYYHAFWGYDHA
jgi:phosphoglycolate phosphatase